MSKSKLERITSLEEQIQQLENRKKKLLQLHNESERKARTKRLCTRAGYLEKILPDTIKLSDGRFEAFVDTHIANRFGISTLKRLKAEQEKEDGKAEESTIISESAQPTPEPTQATTSESKEQKFTSLAELPQDLFTEDESEIEHEG